MVYGLWFMVDSAFGGNGWGLNRKRLY